MTTEITEQNFSSIKSFAHRDRTLKQNHQNYFDNLWSSYGLELTDHPIDINCCFKNQNKKLILEIGYGMGDSLVTMAAQYPCYNFIGVEVFKRGVCNLLKKSHELALDNLKTFNDDAKAVLTKAFKPECLDRIQIYFSDPWPKKKHHKRRLIQSYFIEQCLKMLKPNGLLHIVTDWENYAEHIDTLLSSNHRLIISNAVVDFQTIELSQIIRPTTKFEINAQRLGHQIYDFLYIKK